MSYFHSIRNSRERNFLPFPSVRVSPFKLPSRGKTKRIQSNVLSFIFIRLHPSTSLSVSRWNKILSLSPSTPQIFSFFLSFHSLLLSSFSLPPPLILRFFARPFFILFLKQENKSPFYCQDILSEYCRFYNEIIVARTVRSNNHTQSGLTVATLVIYLRLNNTGIKGYLDLNYTY